MTLYLATTDASLSKDWWVRKEYADWLDGMAPVDTHGDYEMRMFYIRDRAVEENRDGDNCDEGTEAFLDAFGFEPIDRTTTKYVTVTVTVRFQVTNTANEYYTQSDVHNYLSIDASGNVDDMENTEVSIDSVDVESG